jgi:hypothetical protein
MIDGTAVDAMVDDQMVDDTAVEAMVDGLANPDG